MTTPMLMLPADRPGREYVRTLVLGLATCLAGSVISSPGTALGQEVTNSAVPLVSSGGLAGGVLPAPPVATASGTQIPSAPGPSGTASPASVLVTSFETVDFDRNGTYTGSYFIPPDPIGAAGPTHVVCMVNTAIEWYTKSGTLAGGKRLGHNGVNATGSFFEPLSPVTPTFDPKVIYDQYAGRFVAITLERKYDPPLDPSDSSRILVAVSATSDPTGTWYYAAIDSRVGTAWADYPGIGVSDDAVYVTANMFTFGTNGFEGSRLWIVRKGLGTGGLYDGGAATVNLYDPSTAAGLGSQNFTIQPAHMFGSLPSGAKTYLVASGWSAGVFDYLSVITVGGTTASPTFTNTFVSLGGDVHDLTVAFPNAPQLGSTELINTNDSRVINSVCRGGTLWGAMTVVPPSGSPDAGEATAFWFRILVPALTLADKGPSGGEDIGAGTHTFFPAVAVDAAGNAVVGFSASGPTIYPGAYYTFRRAADPAGRTHRSGVLRAGLDYYFRTFSGTRNRWGDYSSVAIDPSDDTFWVFNEFAMERGTITNGNQDGRWRTAFGKFRIPVVASVKLFLQGPYNGASMNTSLNSGGHLAGRFGAGRFPATAVDSINIEIRDSAAASSAGIRSFTPAWLLSDGTVRLFADTLFPYVQWDSVGGGSYYVVVRHRSHIPVMTSSAQSLGSASTPYDFTTGLAQYYGGDAMNLGGGVYGLPAGDVDTNGGVGASDLVNTRVAIGLTTYIREDADMNGGVGASDLVLIRTNIGRATAVP